MSASPKLEAQPEDADEEVVSVDENDTQEIVQAAYPDSDTETPTAHDSTHSKNEHISESAKKAEAARKDRERIKKIRLEQKKALDELRSQQNSEVIKDEADRVQDRLQFLLERTDIFSHFVKSSSILSQLSAHKSTERSSSDLSRMKRRRSVMGEETSAIMDDQTDETESNFVTRWTKTPPFIKGGEMQGYQVSGLNWLIKLYDNGINGILADEMGLGKTLQTLSLLCYLKEVRSVNGPHLIIVPKSTVQNWINEFTRWTPSMQVFAFHGTKEERTDMKLNKLQPGKFNAVVTTYETARMEKNALSRFNWKYLVIDEAHRIKNEKSVLSQVVRLYHSQNRLLITGTPLQNNLHELWALLNFLLPDVFSSSDDFDSWFDLKGDGSQNQQEVIDRLHKVLRPFLLRRIKTEVAKGLPPKTETKLYIGMSSLQRDWYQKILLKDIDSINSAIGTKSGLKPRLLNILMQLRKVCNHPYLFAGAEPASENQTQELKGLIENSGKMVLLDKLLKRLKQHGSRVLIFSQMTSCLDILEDFLAMSGYEYCRIDGHTPSIERQEQIDDFNSPNSSKFCFLLSTRAGGLGINLASADTVILYDSDWNPQVDLQAQDRAHRLGQTKPVHVYRFVTEGTIEEKIVERAELKLKIDAVVIQQGRLVEQNKALSKDEMLSMIKFGADQIFTSKDTTITDEDIDIIIGKGKLRTDELEAKLKKAENRLLDLSFADTATDFDMYTFEGKEYRPTKLADMFLAVPKRERKNLGGGEPGKTREVGPRKPVLRVPKRTIGLPHQFYPKRLVELVDKEEESWKKKQAEFDRRVEAGEDYSGVENLDMGGLTPQEEAEKAKFVDSGFGDWSKLHLSAFLRGCEMFGRTSYGEIAEEVGEKSISEIKKYATSFWQRYNEIPGIASRIAKVEIGEKKIQRKNEMIEALDQKMKSIKSEADLKLDFPTAAGKGKTFSQEEDVFLIFAIHKVGYGNWDELKKEINFSKKFRFDYYLKTRTLLQLQSRVDTLIRVIQKDLASKDGRSFLNDRSKKKAGLHSTYTSSNPKSIVAPEKGSDAMDIDTTSESSSSDTDASSKKPKKSNSKKRGPPSPVVAEDEPLKKKRKS